MGEMKTADPGGVKLSPLVDAGGSHPRVLSRGVTRSDLDFKTVHPGVELEGGLESVSAAGSQCEGERPFCVFVAWAWRLRGWSVRTAPGAVCPFAALQALTWRLAGPPVIAGGCLSVRRDAAMPSGRRPFPEAPAASAAPAAGQPDPRPHCGGALRGGSRDTSRSRDDVRMRGAFSSSLLPTGADPGLRWPSTPAPFRGAPASSVFTLVSKCFLLLGLSQV